MFKKNNALSVLSTFLAITFAMFMQVQAKELTEVEKRVDSIFVIASSGELKYRDMVDPAIDSLATMGAPAVPRLITKYNTKSARERLTIEKILTKIGNPAVPFLRQALTLENDQQVNRICYSLGEIGDTSAVKDLINATNHESWWVRSGSAGALGKIGDNRADMAILSLFKDSIETVRKSAVVASGRLSIEAAIPILIHMLGDSFYGVRMTASETLIGFGDKAVKTLIDSLGSDNEMIGNLGCTTLGLIGTDQAVQGLAGQITSESAVRRALAVEAIGLSNSTSACGLVEILGLTETDPTVIFFINKVLKSHATR
jgi:HEAT repeat protein